MTKREKQKALRLLDEAEKRWRKAKWDYGWELGGECPYCKNYDCYGGNLKQCPVTRSTGDSCSNTVSKAFRTHDRRPVYDLIRKVRKWIEAQ